MTECTEPTEEELNFIQTCAPYDQKQFIKACAIYRDYLYTVNESFNLTRIPQTEFWSKHVCDSLSIGKMRKEFREKKIRICDVGCGAGLPSLILAAAYPNLDVCAIDSKGKKQSFAADAAKQMNLTNVRAFQARSNELARTEEYRHAFQIVAARAVAQADILIRETEDLLCENGELVIYRTPTQADPELIQLNKLKKKKFSVEMTDSLLLPHNAGTRNFLIIRFTK